jgi:hypothetical protein
MAKKNFSKGIDKVFSPTVELTEPSEKAENVKTDIETVEISEPSAAKSEMPEKIQGKKEVKEFANYNLKYPKEMQKRVKRFCIEYDDFDIKDVFIQGANLFMELYRQDKT